MKSPDEIKERIRQLRHEHLQQRIEEKTKPAPENCIHNYKHETEDGTIRLCMLGAERPDKWGGKVCDSEQTAQECPFFEPRKSEEEIREEFEKDVMDPEVVNREFRDISALRWVLESDYDEDLSWWERLQWKIWGP